MPAHLSIGTVIEKNRIASDKAFLIAVEVTVNDPTTGALVEMLRFVNNTENVTFEGNEFVAAKFDITLRAEKGALPNITITVFDVQKVLEARMQAYGGGVGFPVRVLTINTGNLDSPAEISEDFTVTGATSEGYVVTWTLGAENPLAMRLPKCRQFKDRCRFRYKGAECGYAGPLPSCDLSLKGPNGCNVHHNGDRFGGFPGINGRGIS